MHLPAQGSGSRAPAPTSPDTHLSARPAGWPRPRPAGRPCPPGRWSAAAASGQCPGSATHGPCEARQPTGLWRRGGPRAGSSPCSTARTVPSPHRNERPKDFRAEPPNCRAAGVLGRNSHESPWAQSGPVAGGTPRPKQPGSSCSLKPDGLARERPARADAAKEKETRSGSERGRGERDARSWSGSWGPEGRAGRRRRHPEAQPADSAASAPGEGLRGRWPPSASAAPPRV